MIKNHFRAGPSRKRLISGQEVTAEKLLGMAIFDDYPHGGATIKSVLRQLTDEESQQFFRTATGLNAIPRDCTITFKAFGKGGYPMFRTCTKEVFMPVYGEGDEAMACMLGKLREAIQHGNLGFQEF